MGEIYAILVEICMKWKHLSALTGRNSYKDMEKHIILELSQNYGAHVWSIGILLYNFDISI